MTGVLLDPRTGRPEELERARVDELLELAPEHIRDSLRRAARTKWAGPHADRQLFRTRIGPDAMADLTAVAPGAGVETTLYVPGTWASIPALTARSGQTFKLTALGVQTTPATPGTITITPRYGQNSSGAALGASAASATMTASQTNVAWILEFWFDFRLVGMQAASSSTGVGVGRLMTAVLAAPLMFGGTIVTTLDTTAQQGIYMGITFSAASNSMTPRAVLFETLD